jgi:transcription elongation factor Elf1
MQKNIVRYDMLAKPKRQARYLTLLSWIIAFPTVWLHHLKVNKVGMKGLKPPYILLCTHHAFIDFSVTTAAIFPHGANYVVAIDGFINREKLLRNVGCICKRKFTNDIVLVRQIEHSLKVNKTIAAIYPEARYSISGTTAILPDSLGKMCKAMKVPVVVLNMHGNHLSSPVWNLSKRKVRIAADMTQIVQAEEIGILSVDEINARIAKAFDYDEYRYLAESGQKITFMDRAKGLHRVLYQCPHCLTEHEMESDGNRLWCGHCGKAYEVDESMLLHGVDGDGKFARVPDWYEWERANVRKQLEEGNYRIEDDVIVDSLPNSKGFIRLGSARLTHDSSGFRIAGAFDGAPFLLAKEPLENYSIHIEYDYLGKGEDCFSLSTLQDTYYFYPMNLKNVVTKLHFAAEELFKIVNEKIPKKAVRNHAVGV